ncbi:MAG: alpha/beta hydrolase [Muribaculaceae bacterium]|nr:alpha/beta hydrolase [Muribaculaceae bacterium]
MKKLLVAALILASAIGVGAWNIKEKYTGPKTPVTDTSWHPDILEGYEARYVNQGEAFDGPCRSTIIRKITDIKSKKGFLYIHGYNDYFFQKEMGERFVDSGFHFYAVDLRRYGRSKEPWQYPFNIRNQKEYFNDIDSALSQMRRDGITDITLGGHSTGGLTVILFGIDRGARCPVNRIVTNSPFLEWNFNAFMRGVAFPTIGSLGKILPNVKVGEEKCDGYGYSLLKQYYGEWEYNTDWKMIYSPPKTFSWMHAIESAQTEVMKHKENMVVPLLVMHSSRKITGCNYTPEFQTGDCVLDPAMIQRRGSQIGRHTEVCTIDSGLHDLILSNKTARDAAYDSIFSFIRRNQK